MNILPFAKEKSFKATNQELIIRLRDIRTKVKQFKIQEKQILEKMKENISEDNYLYDSDSNPLAQLKTILKKTFNSNDFKEQYDNLYHKFEKESSYEKWFLI